MQQLFVLPGQCRHFTTGMPCEAAVCLLGEKEGGKGAQGKFQLCMCVCACPYCDLPNYVAVRADGSVVGLEEVPHLLLNLGNNSETGVSPCTDSAPVLLSNLSTRAAVPPIPGGAMTGLYKLRVLWQNTPGYGFSQCVKHLNSLTSIDIAPENVIHSPVNASYTLSLQVSFCLSNVTILDSTLVSEGQPLTLQTLLSFQNRRCQGSTACTACQAESSHHCSELDVLSVRVPAALSSTLHSAW